MKQIMFLTALLSSMLFWGCSENTDDFAKGEPEQIVFSTQHDAVTRSVVEGSVMVQDFSVYGYALTGVQTPGYIMKDATFDKDGNPSDGNKYYWPVADNASSVSVIFTAISPSTQAHTFNSASDKVTSSIVTPSVLTSPQNSDNTDILYASKTSSPTKERVPITFNHALSWIQFQGKFGEGITDVKIKSIKFSTGLNTTGDFIQNTTDNTVAWDNIATPQVIEFGNGSKTLKSTEYTVLTDALLIPQSVPASITIKYDITIGDVTYADMTVTKTVNTGKDGNDKDYISSFAAGYRYIYRIYVTADEIKFSPSVTPWQNGTADDIWQIWDEDPVAYNQNSFFTPASMLTASPSLKA